MINRWFKTTRRSDGSLEVLPENNDYPVCCTTADNNPRKLLLFAVQTAEISLSLSLDIGAVWEGSALAPDVACAGPSQTDGAASAAPEPWKTR